ncbi:MAG: NUDIX domain-containing protein [Candidatus Binatia bacterium]|jgi:predicted NUDIX family NTP pyrophosphohydrolase
MPPIAAGCLVAQEVDGRVDVLLVHARRAGFRRPLFGIPKGLVEGDEKLEACACRETLEETGLRVQIRGSLGSVRQKSGKVVHAFWATLDTSSPAAIDEHGRCLAHDWENDICRFYPLEEAYKIMIPAQREFLDRLKKVLRAEA